MAAENTDTSTPSLSQPSEQPGVSQSPRDLAGLEVEKKAHYEEVAKRLEKSKEIRSKLLAERQAQIHAQLKAAEEKRRAKQEFKRKAYEEETQRLLEEKKKLEEERARRDKEWANMKAEEAKDAKIRSYENEIRILSRQLEAQESLNANLNNQKKMFEAEVEQLQADFMRVLEEKIAAEQKAQEEFTLWEIELEKRIRFEYDFFIREAEKKLRAAEERAEAKSKRLMVLDKELNLLTAESETLRCVGLTHTVFPAFPAIPSLSIRSRSIRSEVDKLDRENLELSRQLRKAESTVADLKAQLSAAKKKVCLLGVSSLASWSHRISWTHSRLELPPLPKSMILNGYCFFFFFLKSCIIL